jgi:hypothetical protein
VAPKLFDLSAYSDAASYLVSIFFPAARDSTTPLLNAAGIFAAGCWMRSTEK